MAVLTEDQIRAYAAAAGFAGADLDTITAIAEAESGGSTTVHNPGDPAKGDIENSYGLWQINLDAHPSVTVAEAEDPTFAAQYAHQLFANAGTFSDWGTFESGAYKQYLQGGGSPAGTGTPWWLDRISQAFGVNGEQGTDFATPFHTPVSLLYDGTVVSASYQPWGGDVEVDSNIAGVGSVRQYMIHLDEIDPSLQPGAQIKAGQYIGLSGGENPGFPGAEHPAQPQYSTGPHVEWGLKTLTGEAIDPTQYINDVKGSGLIAGGPPQGQNTTLSSSGDACGNMPNPITDNTKWLVWASCKIASGPVGQATGTVLGGWQQFVAGLIGGIEQNAARGGIILVGGTLAVVGLLALVKTVTDPAAQQAQKIAVEIAPKVAEATA